jgi:hypothetical protein
MFRWSSERAKNTSTRLGLLYQNITFVDIVIDNNPFSTPSCLTGLTSGFPPIPLGILLPGAKAKAAERSGPASPHPSTENQSKRCFCS